MERCKTFIRKLIGLTTYNDIDEIIVHYDGQDFHPTACRGITRNGKKYISITLSRLSFDYLNNQ